MVSRLWRAIQRYYRLDSERVGGRVSTSEAEWDDKTEQTGKVLDFTTKEEASRRK